MLSSIAVVAGLSALAVAAPVEKRQALSQNDITVLQLAHYLENLEYALYSGGYAAYSDAQFTAAGFPAGFRDGVGLTASQEATHRDTLAAALTAAGQTPLPACTYNFPYSDPVSFVDLANEITTVGIGAYLGGAPLITDDAMLLTEAGSILTTEARHDSFLRAGLGGSPFPAPFDTSLSALYAYNLASQFIVSCPQNLPGVVNLPQLKLASPAPQPKLQPAAPAGTTLQFTWDPTKFFVMPDPSKPLYIALVNQNIEAPIFQQVQNLNFNGGSGSVPLPANVTGVAFAVLTTFSSGLDEAALTSYGTLAGPAEIVVS